MVAAYNAMLAGELSQRSSHGLSLHCCVDRRTFTTILTWSQPTMLCWQENFHNAHRMVQGVINKLQVFVNICLRKILKLMWTDKIRNEQLWERTGQVPIQTEIGRRRWKWVGHTLRKGKNSITRQALQWNPQGSRGRGRPRETWRRCMEREMKDVCMTSVGLSKNAQDRDVWRMFVCGLYPDRGERK